MFACIKPFRGLNHCFKAVKCRTLLNLCFDEGVATKFFGAVKDQTRQSPNSWLADHLYVGSQIGDLTVLLRSTNSECVIHDAISDQIFTIQAANLPQQISAAPVEQKQKSIDKLLSLFDEKRVQEITIRIPWSANAPFTYDPNWGVARRDPFNPYAVITYTDGSPSLAAACTIEDWSPHKTQMKMAVLDKNFGCDATNSLWSDCSTAIAIDLSRLASLPAESVDFHFQKPISLATNIGAVLAAMKQIALVAVLNGCSKNWYDLDEGELDMGMYEEELDELDLVIGHYEVDDNSMPLPGAFETDGSQIDIVWPTDRPSVHVD